MNLNEDQPQYAYTILEALSGDYANYMRSVGVLNEAYMRSFEIAYAKAFEEARIFDRSDSPINSAEFDSFIQARTALALIDGEMGVGAVGSFLREGQETGQDDTRISGWGNFGKYEAEVRKAIVGKVQEENSSLDSIWLTNVGDGVLLHTSRTSSRAHENRVRINRQVLEKIQKTVTAPSGERK